MQEAITQYTAAGSDRPTAPQAEAVALMLTQHDIARSFFHNFDYSAFFTGTPAERLRVIPAAMEHILSQDDGKKRYMESVGRLSQAFALSIPHEKALAIRDEVAFFQVVRATFAKITPIEGRTGEDINFAIKQLVSKAVVSPDVINIFEAAGLKSPDVSILSDEFLEDIRHLPQKNLALELLRKLINDDIKIRLKKNAVQARSFADLLDKTILRYQNRSIDAAQVIAELIGIAKEIRASNQRGEELGLSEEELAFYDALAVNGSAKQIMGDRQLAVIAVELVQQVRSNVTIDWTVKQSARAKIRVLVKRILRKYGYPPDLQEKATDLVLEQAELLAAGWTE